MYNVYYKKKRNRILTPIVLALITIICIGMFYYAFNYSDEIPAAKKQETVKRENAESSKQSSAVVTATEPVVIKAGIMKVNYNYKCGHTVKEEREIPEAYIGKTEKDLLEEFSDISSCSYKDGILTADITVNTKCSDHYLVRLNGDKLEIFCEKNLDEAEREITIDVKALYHDEVEILKKGIELGSKTELLEFLEDFES